VRHPIRVHIAYALLLTVLFNSGLAGAEELKHWSGVIDVHSTYSHGGRYTILELARKAKALGIHVVVVTDHLRVRMEYGLPPFRNLFKWSEERKSVHQAGVERYLSEVQAVNRSVKGVVVIPGLKVAPFYYWTGSYWESSLTARNYNKQLLVLGLTDPEDIGRIPAINRPAFSGGNPGKRLFRMAPFLALLIPAIFLMRTGKGGPRIISASVLVFSILGLINALLEKEPNSYGGDPGIRPFQEVIDYVNDRGGMTFWVQPGTTKNHKIGPISLKTPLHHEDLILAKDYTGFEGVYGEDLPLKEPGQEWDVALGQFCSGQRRVPPLIISGLDYYEGDYLSDFQTIFLAPTLDTGSVLDSLRRGRVYAVRQQGEVRAVLDDFAILDGDGKTLGQMGDRIQIKTAPVISIRISHNDGKRRPISGRLIRSGKVIGSFEEKTPLSLKIQDPDVPRDRWIPYRLMAGGILSNPVFVRVAGE